MYICESSQNRFTKETASLSGKLLLLMFDFFVKRRLKGCRLVAPASLQIALIVIPLNSLQNKTCWGCVTIDTDFHELELGKNSKGKEKFDVSWQIRN
jgi:hypothetical protein